MPGIDERFRGMIGMRTPRSLLSSPGRGVCSSSTAERKMQTMKKSARTPDGYDLIEVYDGTGPEAGQEADPLGMYAEAPCESVPADRPRVEAPRWDTQAVRYCSGGKRYLKPDRSAR